MPGPSSRVFDYNDEAAVAKLLAEDAKASSARYATQGLSALLPKRSMGSAPKPNTRFLKNLVRDADQHNAALRRKEDRERVLRLRNGGVRTPTYSNSPEPGRDGREDFADDRHSKRRRIDDSREVEHTGSERRNHKSRHHGRHRSRSWSRTRSVSAERDRTSHRSHRRRSEERTSGRDGHSSDSERDRTSHRKHRRRRSRSRSPRQEGKGRKRSRSPVERTGKDRGHRPPSPDPLEELIGPLPNNKADSGPAVKYRGRGAHKLASVSSIDAHFSSTYDPVLDVRPEDEGPEEQGDWDMALEALRDRQAWKKKHADRLREAGFNDDEIKAWEDSGREKDIRDVKWRGSGQTREWDLGKKDQDESNDDDDDQGRLAEGRLTP